MAARSPELPELPFDGVKGLKQNLRSDLLSGFLVFLIALPLCLGISAASGFPPIAGIFTAAIGGLIVAPMAGSALTIKGPAAGLIVIALGAVESLGQGDAVQGYRLALACIVVAGVLQVVFGLLKLGRFGDFFPSAAVHGMLAAIGIIIFSKQIHPLLGVKPHAKEPLELLAEIPHSIASMNPSVAFIGFVSLAILCLMPRVKSVMIRRFPAPLVVIVAAIPLGMLFGLGQEHIYHFLGRDYTVNRGFIVNLPGNLFDGVTFPDFSRVLSPVSLQYIIMLALVGTIESLLTVKAVDGLDPYHRKADMNKDLLAVGVGNVLCGLVGGLPMISEVVRSSANVNNGAKTRWANFFHGFFILAFVALVPALLQKIPVAALSAMLVFTGYRLAAPAHFLGTYRVGLDQACIFGTTVIVTLATDLLLGVAAGVALELVIVLLAGAPLSALFKAHVAVEEKREDKVRISIGRAAIFSNYLRTKDALESLPLGKSLLVDLSSTRVVDHTFMEYLLHFKGEYERLGGSVHYVGMEGHRAASEHPAAMRRAA